jgi:hypothetical protein
MSIAELVSSKAVYEQYRQGNSLSRLYPHGEVALRVLRKDFCFSSTTSISMLDIYYTSSAMDKPSKQRHAKDTLSSKEDMESELNCKLPDPNSGVPVQHAPLTQSEDSSLPVGSKDAAPVVDRTSNIEALSGFYPDEGYDYGDQYGVFRPLNSTAPTLRLRKQMPGPAPSYVDAYSAPFIDPSA